MKSWVGQANAPVPSGDPSADLYDFLGKVTSRGNSGLDDAESKIGMFTKNNSDPK